MKIYILAIAAFLAGTSAAESRTFVHPGLSYSEEELQDMRTHIENADEPVVSTFEQLKKSPYSTIGRKFDPLTTIREGQFNNLVGQDGRRAHDLALLYRLTDDTRYADEAVRYFNRYVAVTSTSARGTAPLDNGKIYLMLEAAELLRDYDGWSSADREAFNAMLVYPGYSDSVFPDESYNGYDDDANGITFYWNIYNFDSTRWGNQGLFAARALMAMGIYLDNEKMYDRALRYVEAQSSRTDDLPFPLGYPERGKVADNTNEYYTTYNFIWRNGSQEYISDCSIPYYIYSNGQCQESCRDQGHVMVGLGQLVDMAEMAWHQGDDLYGAYDSRILLGLEWSIRYCLSYINGAPWEPVSYTDYENRSTFENGYFYRADSRSNRWHAIQPYGGDRETALNNVRYLNEALNHYKNRTELPEVRYHWLQMAVNHQMLSNKDVEDWGSAGHHYEWKGWGSLTKSPGYGLSTLLDVIDENNETETGKEQIYDLSGRAVNSTYTGLVVTSTGKFLRIK